MARWEGTGVGPRRCPAATAHGRLDDDLKRSRSYGVSGQPAPIFSPERASLGYLGLDDGTPGYRRRAPARRYRVWRTVIDSAGNVMP
jgi:hypothetical protein